MSTHRPPARITAPEIRARKGGRKLVSLTAHSTPIAALLDPHCDLMLVGDSLGMVVHGLPTTVGVTLEMMILHARAVMRGSHRALVAVDLPFGSYEASARRAFASASRVMRESGCQAVKVEAGAGVAESIAFLTARGIPVVGHVGLRPQAAHVDGGFKVKGRTTMERDRVLAEARDADAAGAFCLVVEGVTPDVADEVTRAVGCPTIGIGASPSCDGQVLVTEDLLGLFERSPKFVRRYGDLRGMVEGAASAFARDVRDGSFPAPAELYAIREGA